MNSSLNSCKIGQNLLQGLGLGSTKASFHRPFIRFMLMLIPRGLKERT